MVAACALGMGATAHARPGTHGPSMSTWDTRASSVAFQARLGFLDGGHSNSYSYNANFTSTSGNLSAQFGLHYLNIQPNVEVGTLHGASASATAVVSQPLTERFDNGVPTVALAFYMGAVPAVLTAGPRNDITLPLVFGLGVPVSPDDWITLTPWVEPSVSGNLDTKISSFDLGAATGEFDDLRAGMDDGSLSEGAVEEIVDESVDVEFSANIGLRAGLAFALHLGTGADINLGVELSSLGGAFSGPTMVTANAAFVWRWDNIVPTVLPPTGPQCECTQPPSDDPIGGPVAEAAPPIVAPPEAPAPAPSETPMPAPSPAAPAPVAAPVATPTAPAAAPAPMPALPPAPVVAPPPADEVSP